MGDVYLGAVMNNKKVQISVNARGEFEVHSLVTVKGVATTHVFTNSCGSFDKLEDALQAAGIVLSP